MDLQSSSRRYSIKGFAIVAAIVLPSNSFAECLDLSGAVQEISVALQDVELEQAASLSDQAISALDCQESVVNPMVLANLMQLSGAVHYFNEDTKQADKAFAWAVAVSPNSTLDPMYGDDASQSFKAVQSAVITATPGSMVISGEVEAWIDGKQVNSGESFSVSVGQHLMQWTEETSEIHNRVIQVDPNDQRVIKVGRQVGPASAALAAIGGTNGAPASPLDSIRPAIKTGGYSALAAGAVVLGLAFQSNRAFFAETDPTRLNSLQSKTNGLAVAGTALTIVGVSATGGGVLLDSTSAGVQFTVKK